MQDGKELTSSVGCSGPFRPLFRHYFKEVDHLQQKDKLILVILLNLVLKDHHAGLMYVILKHDSHFWSHTCISVISPICHIGSRILVWKSICRRIVQHQVVNLRSLRVQKVVLRLYCCWDNRLMFPILKICWTRKKRWPSQLGLRIMRKMVW